MDSAFEKIDKAKANVERNLKNAEELFQSALDEVFSNPGEDWEVKALGEVCELIKRGISPKYSESGLAVINQRCIRGHKVNMEVARFHNLTVKKVNPERIVQRGDVLINSTGQGTLGRTAQILNLPPDPVTVDSHVTIARPQAKLFYVPFFGYAVRRLEDAFIGMSTGTSGQTELGRKVISENCFVPIPPLDEQQEIVSRLDALSGHRDEVVAKCKKELIDLEEMRHSILEQAFVGKLTSTKSQ